jgi:hypothetical protein
MLRVCRTPQQRQGENKVVGAKTLKCQSKLFSATMHVRVQRLSRKHLSIPIVIVFVRESSQKLEILLLHPPTENTSFSTH